MMFKNLRLGGGLLLKPEIGQVVGVRSRRHLVEDVKRGDTPDDLTIVALSCLEDDAQGEQTTVLWEKEIGR